jgi:hypothetical protein
MFPFRSLQVGVYVSAIAKANGIEADADGNLILDGGDIQFAYCDALTVWVDFKLKKNSPTELKALEAYWQLRNGSPIGNREQFNMLITADVRSAWWEAYTQTRDDVGAADEALQEDAVDPEV